MPKSVISHEVYEDFMRLRDEVSPETAQIMALGVLQGAARAFRALSPETAPREIARTMVEHLDVDLSQFLSAILS